MENNSNQKVSCVVNFAYEASEPDELTLRTGDVIRDVEKLPGGWWRGELRGKRGMFPDNFVTLLSDTAPARCNVQGRCRAVFSYQPANPDELTLCVGDVLDVLAEVEEGWWQGRRHGRVGVFPSNFVVMIDQETAATAPALPPKPVKEQCRVLFPYTAVNEDELTLAEGDIVTLVSKEAPDRGWWRGELRGRVGLFPDNFVQIISSTPEIEEKKPDRPPAKNLYPNLLNKYSEKTTSIKEISTARSSVLKENSNKEVTSHTNITHTNKSETEKLVHNEAGDGIDGQFKKPPVPSKKSPTPTSAVTGILSGLKSKILSTTEKERSSTVSSSTSSSSGEWDKPDGLSSSKPAANTNTFDHVERNSILNDPRAGRVKAPRRRPPSQLIRDDSLTAVELSNGHETAPSVAVVENSTDKLPDKAEEIKPRAREWEKHRAPWMEELKLNQAKKTSFVDGGKRGSVEGNLGKVGSGSTDRILDVGLEEKKSTHSMEMSKSTSSISTRMSVLESYEETKVRNSIELKKESMQLPTKETEVSKPATGQSPNALGRNFSAMLDEVKKPSAPSPPQTSVRTSTEVDKSVNVTAKDKAVKPEPVKSEPVKLEPVKTEPVKVEPIKPVISSKVVVNSVSSKANAEKVEKINKTAEKVDKPAVLNDVVPMNAVVDRPVSSSTLERRMREDKKDGVEVLIAQLNDRISNLEKLLEVQNAKFNEIINELSSKLAQETERRQALQNEVQKLAHCVTQV